LSIGDLNRAKAVDDRVKGSEVIGAASVKDQRQAERMRKAE